MMKKIIPFFLLILCFSTTLNLNSYATLNEENRISQELLIEEAFLRSMSREIYKAIKDNYGESRSFFLPRITKVTKNEAEDNFDVTVQVVTYERAILPPYGLETITFRIPGYTVINFEHKEIRGEDLPKDKFNQK